MNNPKAKPQQGPDPAVMLAIQRLVQTELSPLEEVIFKSWMEANQLEEQPDVPFDYRGLYQQTGGKVYAPGQLGSQIAHQNAMDTLTRAQADHDAASPMKAMMDAMNSGQSLDLNSLGGQEMPQGLPQSGGAMDAMSQTPEPAGGAMDSMSAGIDNSEPSF
jgi:hypothetical protein